jgi:hypothetical protein
MPVKFACSFPAILFSTFMMISCSKKEQSTPESIVKNCRIKSATITNGSGNTIANYTYQYASDGKLIETVYAGSYNDTVRFSYGGNMIYSTFSSDIYSSFDTIKLNAEGLIEYQKESGTDGTYLTNYTYNGGTELQSFIVHQNPYPSDSVFYTFSNGDAVTRIEGPGIDSITYDLNKPAVTGNMDEFSELLSSGAFFIKNKHLITSVKHYNSISPASNSVTTYSYEYTPEGNISSVKASSGNTLSVTSYIYDCN